MRIDELSEKRKKWVEANRENDFEEGIKNLFSNFYPDNAHFIYELLQNAEDAGASEVRFILNNDSAEFEHNGSNLFTIEDVESITSIGSSTKSDDPTSIGEFGIGFKAVFAYTSTPEIESGEYHFRIRDLIVPDTEGLSPGSLGERKTCFVFPFDNPEKSPQKAREEIEKNLRELNESTLLFLNNIRKIEYHLPDSSGSGSLEMKEKDGNRIEIALKRPGKRVPELTHYLRFKKVVPVKDENAHKDCRIAVAFGMEKQRDQDWKITPLNPGQVCIYFPAMKETSKLRFHLHAPFASTVARDSVRDDSANDELLKHLANLIAESMSTIRDQGLLNVEFLATLPNNTDLLSSFYLPIREGLIDAFNKEKLTPTKRGAHAAASVCYRGARALSDLINDKDLATLLGEDPFLPLWIANPRQRNQREDNFLNMLDISEWTTDDFIGVLETESEQVMEWLKEKPDDWYQELYGLLGEFLSSAPSYPSYVTRKRKNRLSNLRIVRCSHGIYRVGSDCHFLGDDIEPDEDLQLDTAVLEEENQSPIQEDSKHEKDFHYVAKGVYSSGQNKDQQEKAREFLKTIGICEVDEVERIKMILKQRYTHGSIKPRFQDMKRFIALVEDDPHKKSLFNDYFIFEVDLKRDNARWFSKPGEVFVDSPYLDTGLTAYYETISENSEDFKRALSPNYRKSGIALERFGKFAETVGAQTKLALKEETIPSNHPENPWLKRDEGNESNITRIDQDYIIPRFKEFLDRPSINNARLIWRTMNSLDEKYLKARFRGNQNHPLRTGASSLVHDLRNAKWVPQKNGDSIAFVRPCDGLREHLPVEGFLWPKGYPHDAGEKWLDEIEFSKAAREQGVEHIQRNQKAKDLGFDSGDDAEKWAYLAQNLKEKGISIDDVKSQFSSQDNTTPNFPTSSSKNRKRRSQRIMEQLRNTPPKAETPDVNVQIRRRETDPHTELRELYTNDSGEMACQICKEEMPFKKRDGEYYFETVEMLTSYYFPKEYEAQFLALCPECVARYKYFVKEDIEAMEALKNQLMNSNDLKVSVQLGELETSIRFVETHLLDLKDVLYHYEKEH